jgi:cold-inducible RNA-binding protein
VFVRFLFHSTEDRQLIFLNGDLQPGYRERLCSKHSFDHYTMKLYVGNLSFSTTDPDLKDLFGQHGTVTDVHLVTDRVTGRSRGFAFVTMSSGAEGKAAIGALEGKELDGRNLTVNEARPKEEGGKGGKRSFSRSRW